MSSSTQKNTNKWFYAFIGAALLLVGAIVTLIIMGVSSPDAPVQPADGAETGVYYYEVVDGEILLSLNSGNKFTLAGPTVNKSGDYSVSDGKLTLDFIREEDKTATATLGDATVTLVYEGKTMTFIKKQNFTVSFDTVGANAIAPVTVLNGKTLNAPEAPVKTGSVFIGWYTDASYTARFEFGNTPITKNTTLYARWADKAVGASDFSVKFDLAYEGSPEIADAVAIGGKIYDLPSPKRDGYVFGGWFVSMYCDGDMLSYECTENSIISEDTTLFAVWHESGKKLPSPAVSVSESAIKWNSVSGSISYQVKITSPDGTVIHERSTGTTSESFDFSLLAAGDYVVEVVAISSSAINNSAPAVRYFKNKALDRVSGFSVVDGVLIFNPVSYAEKYLVSVDCGNSEHNHTLFDNGLFTSFDFTNCDMQNGGILFTVTAVADGYASSVSETFVYDRTLLSPERVEYDSERDAFVWDAVPFASNYTVTVTVNAVTHTFSVGTATFISVSDYTGTITVSVVPTTKGYNSPDPTSATVTKTAPATPKNISVNGMTLTWDAAMGALSYEVKIGAQVFAAETNLFSLSNDALKLQVGESHTIQIKSIGENGVSPYSESVSFGYYLMNPHLTYKDNTVYWTPVIGVENYEVRVNGGKAIAVSGSHSLPITLTKSGVNLIEVRYTDFGESDWAKTEVYAYEIVYDSRSMNGESREYLAVGDRMTPPLGLEKLGYTLTGWYNTPAAANGNGAPHASLIFAGTGDTTLYANWTPNDYSIKFFVDDTITNIVDQSTVTVTYTKSFTLPIAESTDEERGYFAGWYDGPSGSGTQLTDASGNSIAPYPYTRDTVVYPFFDTGILSYELLSDGTYGVKKGPNVNNGVNVKIPVEYKGVPVTMVLDNAFYNCDSIKNLYIPDTIKQIGVGVFTYADSLEHFEVYKGRPGETYETFYSSDNGAIIFFDKASDKHYLEFFPKAKTGDYTVPEGVDSIKGYAFRTAIISKIIIEKDVTYIAENAFYSSAVKTIEFVEGGDKPLVIENDAFKNANSVTTLKLPKRLTALSNIKSLDRLTSLKTLTVEAGGTVYSSVDNMLCNGLSDTILYAPKALSGEFTVPAGIKNIGANVFTGNFKITALYVPRFLSSIGEGCFEGCMALSSVVFEGDRNSSLIIGSNAFKGSALSSVTFMGSEDGELDRGSVSVGDYAFASCASLSKFSVGIGASIAKLGKHSLSDCTSLKEIDVNAAAALVFIDDYAFAGCTGLKSFTANKYTTNINNYVFSGCEYLESFAFSSDIGKMSFGSYVFDGCKRLESVEIPASLENFDGTAFNNCVSLKTINVDKENPYLVTIGGVLYTKDISEILFYPKALDADEETLSLLPWDKITTIGGSVFGGNNKISTMVIGAKVTSIGAHAFDGCQKLKKITFAENTEPGANLTIGEYAFANCPRLTSLPVPSYTSEIGAYALYNSALKIFTIPEALSVIRAHTFDATKLMSINIPANITEIEDGAFANVSSLKTLTFDDGSLPLTLGSSDASSAADGVFAQIGVESVIIPDRITVIGSYAFYNVTSLKTIEISSKSNLEEIGGYAFFSTSFSSINLGDKLTTIGNYAFSSSSIASVSIPSSVSVIGNYAFSTAKLSSVSFGEGDVALTIGDYAFASATFTKINLPARLIAIGGMHSEGYRNTPAVFNKILSEITVTEGGTAFASLDGVLYEIDSKTGDLINLVFCPKAKVGEVIIPNTVISVESGAFNNTNLTRVTFEEFDKSDERYATPLLTVGTCTTTKTYNSPVFGNSKTLKYITFPSHLKTLGGHAVYLLTLKNPDDIESTEGIIRFNPDTQPIELQKNALSSASSIKELYLPAIKYMDTHSVYQFTNLLILEIAPGSTLTEIPMSGFAGARRVKSFTLPKSVQSLGTHAFSDWRALTEFKYEEGCALREIGSRAFQSSAFEEFTIPSTVELIGQGVFTSCPNLKTIRLAKEFSAISISSNFPFNGISTLERIEVEEGNKYLSSIDGVLFDAAGTILYAYPAAKIPEGGIYTVPDGIITIYSYAFSTFGGKEVILPASLENIGAHAFEKSDTLERIIIPASVKELGSYTFSNCKSLTYFAANPEGMLETIGEYCFEMAESLKTVILPDSVKKIGTRAFQNCASLEEIIIPQGMTEISDSVFSNCYALKSVTLQDGLAKIDNYAFFGCSSLDSITIPDTVTRIGNSAFRTNASLKNVVITQNSLLESVETNAFADCSSLESIYLGEKIKSLGVEVFINCTSLKNASVGGELTVLTQGAFSGCTALESFAVSSGITLIDGGTFENCSSLTEVYIPASVSIIGASAFNNCSSLSKVNIENASRLTTIAISAFSNTVSLQSIDLPDGVITIYDKAFENSGITEISLPSSLSSIGSSAFRGCVALTKADLPSGVKSVGAYAFEGCISLESADLSLSLESLGESAFQNCISLERIHIPAGLVSMNGNPFVNCINVKSFTLAPENESFILDDGVLLERSGHTLIYYSPAKTNTTYTVPETVYEIASGAFAGAKFESFTVPDNVTVIRDYTFLNCKNLVSIEIPYSITAIGKGAFMDCSALTAIQIPSSVSSIGSYAFSGCESLANVNYEERSTQVSFGTYLFENCKSITSIEAALPKTTTAFTAYMFKGAGIINLAIPSTIYDLSTEGVFYGCESLKSVSFPSSVGNCLGDAFFHSCTSLEAITIPDSIQLLGTARTSSISTALITGEVFKGCASLKTVSFGSGISHIAKSSFEDCVSLTTVTIRNASRTALYLDSRVFANCTSLSSMEFLSYIDSFGTESLLNCSSLVGVLMGRSVGTSEIGANAFLGCTGITEIHIKTPGRIYANSFAGLSENATVYFDDKTEEDVLKYFPKYNEGAVCSFVFATESSGGR